MPLKLEIVTPDGVAWNGDNVDSVTLPTKSGEIEVLAGHIPLVTILEAGELAVHTNGKTEFLAIDKGHARIMGDVISVLTEAAINFEDIDVNEAENARAAAEKAIAQAHLHNNLDDDELSRLQAIAKYSIAQTLVGSRRKK